MEQNKRKCLIIYNPISGKGVSDDILLKYCEILKEKGFAVDFKATKSSNDATKAIVSATDYDIVFSIGGDGTLNEIVKGNYLRDERLTICPLPSGTCNDVATMLGYGKNPIDNLNMALDGEIHTIDIATINDNPFVYVVGMGKLMNIPYETKSEDKRKNGYIAYLKGAINELLDKMKRYKAEVIVDGKRLDGNYSLIMISNANHIAGIDNFYKEVCLNDGLMEVLLCKSNTTPEFIKDFLKFLAGRKTNDIISLKAHEITIKLIEQPDKEWCIDGEKYDYNGTEYKIRIQDQMKILTPKAKTKKLFRNKGGELCKTL